MLTAVAEVVSPSARTNDRRWKPEAYAEAGIATFLRVELPATGGVPEIIAFVLDPGGATARPPLHAVGSAPPCHCRFP